MLLEIDIVHKVGITPAVTVVLEACAQKRLALPTNKHAKSAPTTNRSATGGPNRSTLIATCGVNVHTLGFGEYVRSVIGTYAVLVRPSVVEHNRLKPLTK